MIRASESYERLSLAGVDTDPACQNDDRFTADDLGTADMADLAAICDTCALFAPCQTYATTARPRSGFWAGKPYPTPQPRKKGDR